MKKRRDESHGALWAADAAPPDRRYSSRYARPAARHDARLFDGDLRYALPRTWAARRRSSALLE
jgi:hypothetical protein